MTAQRDDLVEDIRAIDGPAILGGDVMADGLIAAGYRKLRTITTVEEVDALPNDSVIAAFDVNDEIACTYQRDYYGLWMVAGLEERYTSQELDLDDNWTVRVLLEPVS